MHHIFFFLCSVLFVLCLAASSPDLPCHLLSMALHPSSAMSGGERLYSPLPSAQLTPCCTGPTCSRNAVQFCTGRADHLAHTAGGGRPEGSVVVLSWYLLLFPLGMQQGLRLLAQPLALLPPFLREAPPGSRSLVLWPLAEGGCVTPGGNGSSSSRWLLATSGKAAVLSATWLSSPHAPGTHRPQGSTRQPPVLCGAVWEPLAWYSGHLLQLGSVPVVLAGSQHA